MMKKITLITIAIFSILTCSKANGKEIKGLLITKNVTLYKSASKQATKVGILYGSRICLPNEEVAGFIDNTSNHGKRYYFSLIDGTERIEKNGLWAKYYQPAQDDVPAQYIDMKEFEQATKDVTIYLQAPASWEVGKTYGLEAENKKNTSVLLNISITPIRITTNATLKVYLDTSTTEKEAIIPMQGKVVYKIIYSYEKDHPGTTYMYEDHEIVLGTSSDNDENLEYEELELDTNGKTFSKNSKTNKKKAITALEAASDTPSFGSFGWIFSDKVVIDSDVYTRKK
jgi:hypothetical protein